VPGGGLFVHVLPPADTRGTSDTEPLARVREAQARLGEIAHALGVRNADVNVVSGDVGEELYLIAEESESDLVCIGVTAHGTTGLGRAARALLQQRQVSCLFVPAAATTGAVHAAWIDASSGAAVLQTASSIAEALGEDLDALCFLPVADWSPADPDGIEQRRLADVLRQAHVAGVETIRVDAAQPHHVGEQLASYVGTHRAGLLIVDAAIAQMALGGTVSPNEVTPLRPLVRRCPVLVRADMPVDHTRTMRTRAAAVPNEPTNVPRSVTAPRSNRGRLIGELRRPYRPPDDGGAA
jgi:hypothetical protein